MMSSDVHLLPVEQAREVQTYETDVTPPPGRSRVSHRATLVAELLVVSVAAIIVRSLGMGRQSLWLDEAYSVYLSSHRLPQILDFTASSDAHPPLYYLLLHIWMALFGPSALAVRELSLLASVAAALMTYFVGRVVGSHRAALLAALMMALSSFQIWYAQEARMYALTTLATLVALYGLTRALRDTRARYWTIFVTGMLAALYLDYSAGYVLFGVIVWFVVAGRRRVDIIVPFVASMLAVLIGYLPWLPSFLQQIRGVAGLTAWIGGASGTGLMSVLTDFFFNRSNLSEPSGTLIGWLATGVSLVAVAYALWAPRRHPGYPLLALWVACPLGLGLISEFYNHPITISRTMMVVLPELLLLLALAVDTQLATYAPGVSARIRLLMTGLLLSALLVGNIGAQISANTTTIKEDWHGAASLVASHQQPGDLILFNAYYAQMPFDYYYHQQAASAEHVVVERGYLTEESLLYADFSQGGAGLRTAQELQSYARVWLIISHAPSPGSATPTIMATHYHLVSEQRLVGVTVLLYLKSV
ncbi:MAG TPA: glycosyltransferase family 39 protein [Ktedonobacterales bacterium]|jgi:hypothetical protein|nr:glycosyltransferase family 39 protein [Ktedonobacterales bacterium]